MDVTNFKPGGCAEFIYGQIEATSRLNDERKQHIADLLTWFRRAESLGFTKLSLKLHSHYTTQRKMYQEECEKKEKMEKKAQEELW